MQPAVLALLLTVVAYGSNDQHAPPDCAACHRDVTVSEAHAGVPCSACHTSVRTLPHAGASSVECRSGVCHPVRRPPARPTLHDRAAGADWLAAAQRCVACHGGHEARTGPDAVAGALAVDPECTECHGGRDGCSYVGPHQADPPGGPGQPADRRAGALACAVCHGVHEVRDLDDPLAPLARPATSETCGGCHELERERYQRSRHARGVRRGMESAPTCLGCHAGAGPSPRTDHAMSTERVVTTCTGCHEDPRVLAASDLPYEVVVGYESSAHGVAFLHGASDVAVCASCHDPHQVLPPDHPDSMVNPERVARRCEVCHESVDAAMLESVHRAVGSSRLAAGMQAFFPVVGRSVNPLLVAGVGAAVGVLSGFFGVGASFLMTPLLIFIGIPAAVAVATDSAHLTAVAASNAVRRGLRGSFDPRLTVVLVGGGWAGGVVGVYLVRWLRDLGTFDGVVRLLFVVILGWIGVSTLLDVLRGLRGRRVEEPAPGPVESWLGRLPLAVHFPRSGIRASLVLLVGTGALVGGLAALLGVSGGFLMLPVLIYVLGVPNRMAVGTDLIQIVLTCGLVAVLHAVANHTVDALLALVLFVGSVVGVRIGGALARRVHGEMIGLALALTVIAVAIGLAWQLVATPPATVEVVCSWVAAR